MFRRTCGRHMKPYLHAFSPGARASEKGMMYRNNYMNAHARVGSMQAVQRTQSERAIFLMLLLPEQVFGAVFVALMGLIGAVLVVRSQPFGLSTSKKKWLVGGMTQHELFERNTVMSEIFDMHKDAIDNTRAELDRPEVLTAPSGYQSRSALYSPLRE